MKPLYAVSFCIGIAKRIMKKLLEKQLNKNHIFLWAMLFTLLFSVAEHFFAQYSDIDNFLISVVTNGVYSEDNFTFFVHPFLCQIIKALRLISKAPDWYLLITEITVYFSFFCLEKMILTVFGDRSIKALCNGMFLLFLFVSLDAVHVNFTVMTAVLCFSGSILIIYATGNLARKFEMIAGIIIWFTAFLFRIETCLVMLAFLFLALLIQFLFLEKDKRISFIKRNLLFAITFVFIFLVMFIGREVVIRSEKYESGYEYSVTRSAITDYYESGTSYIHLLMDTESLDNEGLKAVLEQEKISGVKLREDPNPVVGLFKTFKNAKKAMMLSIFVLLLAGVLIFDDRKNILPVLITLTAGFGGCVYYYFSGRLPERIILLFDLGMLTVFVSNIQKKEKEYRPVKYLLALWSVLLIVIVFPKGKYMTGQNVFAANIDNEPENIGIEADSNIYIWDVYLFDVKIMYPYWDAGKLFSPSLVRKHIPDGEWVYGQPYFEEMLNEIDLANPLQGLLNRDDVFYVAYDGTVKNMAEYLFFSKNTSVTGAVIGNYDVIPINKFIVK